MMYFLRIIIFVNNRRSAMVDLEFARTVAHSTATNKTRKNKNKIKH